MVDGVEHRFRHHPLLGTVVEVSVADATEETGEIEEHAARRIDDVIVTEFERLERVFSAYDRDSELERWKRGELDAPSDDFCRAMATALEWQRRSSGAFNTASGFLTDVWRSAERRGEPPPGELLAEVAAAIAEPRYVIDGTGCPRLIGDGSGVNLNAFVKGWIVDRAVAAALASMPGVSLVVSAGGDLVHHGGAPAQIGIENPLRPYDNEPPITTIHLADAGLATSGRARRGFRIGGDWYAHVVDPRTGLTVDHVASVSIVAADAATADVIATIAGLMVPRDAVAYATGLGVACLIIDPSGERFANDRWRRLE